MVGNSLLTLRVCLHTMSTAGVAEVTQLVSLCWLYMADSTLPASRIGPSSRQTMLNSFAARRQ